MTCWDVYDYVSLIGMILTVVSLPAVFVVCWIRFEDNVDSVFYAFGSACSIYLLTLLVLLVTALARGEFHL